MLWFLISDRKVINPNIYTGTLYREGKDDDNDDILGAEHKTGINYNYINSLVTSSQVYSNLS